MTRVAIVAGICVEHDAISAAVAAQAEMLMADPSIEHVSVFALHFDRELPCDEYTVGDSWQLLRHEVFRSADVAIFHWGIYYDLFHALVVLGDPDARSLPSPAVHFHNCTPIELVQGDDAYTVQRSLEQLELLGTLPRIAPWTYSPFNVETLIAIGVDPARIKFVPFPIEPPRALRPAKREGRVDIACVGRILAAKGQRVLVEAIALLPRPLRDRVTVSIAGNATFSSRTYLDDLLADVTRFGLDDHVRFVGQPDDEGLWRLYETSHLLVSTSFHEGLCVPVVEAYAAGCRAIGTDRGNLKYIIQPPDPVVPAGSPEALATAIATVADDILERRPVDRTAMDELVERYSRRSARTHTDSALADLLTDHAARV